MSPAAWKVPEGHDEDGHDGDKVCHRYPVVGDNARRHAPRDEPEEEDGDAEEDRQHCGEPVRRVVVRDMMRRGASGISYQRWHVDLVQVEPVKVEAPTPDSYSNQKLAQEHHGRRSRLTERHDEAHAVRQRKHPAERVELRLDSRVTVHCRCDESSSIGREGEKECAGHV